MKAYEIPVATVQYAVEADILTVSVGDRNDPLYEQEFGEAGVCLGLHQAF